jgi:hypothetical protein
LGRTASAEVFPLGALRGGFTLGMARMLEASACRTCAFFDAIFSRAYGSVALPFQK